MRTTHSLYPPPSFLWNTGGMIRHELIDWVAWASVLEAYSLARGVGKAENPGQRRTVAHATRTIARPPLKRWATRPPSSIFHPRLLCALRGLRGSSSSLRRLRRRRARPIQRQRALQLA